MEETWLTSHQNAGGKLRRHFKEVEAYSRKVKLKVLEGKATASNRLENHRGNHQLILIRVST